MFYRCFRKTDRHFAFKTRGASIMLRESMRESRCSSVRNGGSSYMSHNGRSTYLSTDLEDFNTYGSRQNSFLTADSYNSVRFTAASEDNLNVTKPFSSADCIHMHGTRKYSNSLRPNNISDVTKEKIENLPYSPSDEVFLTGSKDSSF